MFPKIILLYNESPDWPEVDKQWSARMVAALRQALTEKGYEYRAVKFFDSLAALDSFDPRQWLIWNWAEEIGGQPWTEAEVAAELERRGFAYTGSPPAVLTFSYKRIQVKQRLQALGLPTLPAGLYTDPAQAAEWKVFPAIVKGANQHGSFGIDRNAVVHDPEQLARRIAYLRETYNDDALVEQFLDSREFHVSVLGNGNPQALPPAEYDYSAFADLHDRIYTYTWKYDEKSWGFQALKIVSPAPADQPALQARLQTLAVAAYKAVGLTDYGRIDLRMRADEPQILDVNPNPDLDVVSALILSAQAVGMSYSDVVERIIRYAAARMPG